MVDAWSGPTPNAQQFPGQPADAVARLLDVIERQRRELNDMRSNLLSSAGLEVAPEGLVVTEASTLEVRGGLSTSATGVTTLAGPTTISGDTTISGSLTLPPATIDEIVAQIPTGSGNLITYATIEPDVDGDLAGDTWWQLDAGEAIGLWQWDGAAWVPQTLGSAVLAGIEAGKIITGTLAAGVSITAGDPGGAHVVLDSDGLRHYDALGAVDVDLTGSPLFSGTVTSSDVIGSRYRTALSGNRIDIDTGNYGWGTLGTIEFYDSASSLSGRIYARETVGLGSSFQLGNIDSTLTFSDDGEVRVFSGAGPGVTLRANLDGEGCIDERAMHYFRRMDVPTTAGGTGGYSARDVPIWLCNNTTVRDLLLANMLHRYGAGAAIHFPVLAFVGDGGGYNSELQIMETESEPWRTVWTRSTGAEQRDSGWRDISANQTADWSTSPGSVYIRRLGKTVYLRMQAIRRTGASGVAFTIPTGFKPLQSGSGIERPIVASAAGTTYRCAINDAGSDGYGDELAVYNTTVSTQMYGSHSYITDQTFPTSLPGTAV